mgnify:CR=1 FL=1
MKGETDKTINKEDLIFENNYFIQDWTWINIFSCPSAVICQEHKLVIVMCGR